MRKQRLVVWMVCLAMLLVNLPAAAQVRTTGAVPDFACTDDSYTRAVRNGLTLGFSPSPPYTFVDPATNEPGGIDWEINVAALNWMGITEIRYEVMPWESLIPSLLSGRIDVLAANIHETPDRLKVISFTGPAWWYGPAVIVQKGNPENIQSYDDLKGRRVGAISGSAADEYLRRIGAEVVPFKTDLEEFTSVHQGRVAVILEDDVKFAEYMKHNPDANLEALNIDAPLDLIFGYGYDYARYGLRKEDCTLRAAYTRALAELRGDGTVSRILRNWGLTDRNLMWFQLEY